MEGPSKKPLLDRVHEARATSERAQWVESHPPPPLQQNIDEFVAAFENALVAAAALVYGKKIFVRTVIPYGALIVQGSSELIFIDQPVGKWLQEHRGSAYCTAIYSDHAKQLQELFVPTVEGVLKQMKKFEKRGTEGYDVWF
jgi:hypothetical protein